MKTALICGVRGQDGSLLARYLLGLGYRVVGTSRDAEVGSSMNLELLGIADRIRTISMVPNDFQSVLEAVEGVAPDEIYYLAGQSSVGLSFTQPSETFQSLALGTINLLEAVRFAGGRPRLFSACSGECFGNVVGEGASESTPFHPQSPYSMAKAAGYWAVASYREAYGLFACSGILFNHESPLRPRGFVTAKIVDGARLIAGGEVHGLTLGRLDVIRDWGWAAEYVVPMHGMLQQERPDDFVIGTGVSSSLEDFVAGVFSRFDLDW
ncbi:GDP-mannose 4,6-dehydratase, partial [Gemmatimonadota bacterium]